MTCAGCGRTLHKCATTGYCIVNAECRRIAAKIRKTRQYENPVKRAQFRAATRAWRAANREKCREYLRAYRQRKAIESEDSQ